MLMVTTNNGVLLRSDMQHLREFAPLITCNSGYAPLMNDVGFRTLGKVQFLASLHHY